MGYDLVPEPKIIDAALRACRRLNDFASAVRILEVVKVGAAALPGEFAWLFPAAGINAVLSTELPGCLRGWEEELGKLPVKTPETSSLKPESSLPKELREARTFVSAHKAGLRWEALEMCVLK